MTRAENKKKLLEQFKGSLKGIQTRRDELKITYEERTKVLNEEKELLELQQDAIKKA